MPSPFPGMDPFVEENPLFHELHTQMLAECRSNYNRKCGPSTLPNWSGTFRRAAFGTWIRAWSRSAAVSLI